MKQWFHAILPVLLAAACSGENIQIGQIAPPDKPVQGQPFTLSIPVKAECENPYDSQAFFVNAHMVTPKGKKAVFPCYYAEPYALTSQTIRDVRAHVALVRFAVRSKDWPKGERVELYLDELELEEAGSGRIVPLDMAEDPAAWKAEGMQVGLSRDFKAQGEASILGAAVLPKDAADVTPALSLRSTKEDWSAYSTLRVKICLRSSTDNGTLQVTLDGGEHGQVTESLTAKGGGYIPGRWTPVRIRLPHARKESRWEKTGEPEWRLTFTAPEAGAYQIRIFAETPKHWAKSESLTIHVAPGTRPRNVRVSPRDPAYLEYDDGQAFFPLGLNICWGDPAQMVDYLEKLASHGGNFVRIWMSPWSFPLEWEKAGHYDQKAAAQLDFVFRNCERLGLKMMLCLDYHGELRPDQDWPRHPYSVAREGPCDRPEEFFTGGTARDLYKRRLTYLIARYASSPALAVWELFNEVGLTPPHELSPYKVMDWHATMARYLKRHDPLRHPVTTSVGGDREWESLVWRARDIDLVQAHRYAEWRSSSLEAAQAVRNAVSDPRRPILLSEFGLPREHARHLDPTGRAFHNALWAGTLQGAAGSPMPWWWDVHVHEFNLYPQITALGRFVQGVDFPGEQFRPLDEWTLEFPEGNPDSFGPVIIQPSMTAFKPAPFNRPQSYVVRRDGTVDGPADMAETIHGQGDHRDLHNPQTFAVDYPADGAFAVAITEVSNWNSSELKILLDGQPVLQQAFEDKDPASGIQYRYNGVYRVPVPAGKHRITVDNEGLDWVKVAYVLENYRGYGPRALSVCGLAGRTRVLVRAWTPESVYYAPWLGVRPCPVKNATLRLDGLPNAPWQVSLWDPETGQVLSERNTEGRPLRIPLPPVIHDIAVELKRL